MKSAIAVQRSGVQLQNPFDVNNIDSDGSDPPLVLIAVFLANSLYISSKLIGSVTGGLPLISVSL